MSQTNNHLLHSGLAWVWISIIVVILDQVSKIWADTTLVFGQPVEILPFLNFTLLYNTGVAFSFMADAGGWQRWLFTGLAAVISVIIMVWMARTPRSQIWVNSALAMILGGAIGNNLIDRLLYGHVIDFIDVYYQQWHWPVFNIADSAITVGAIMLLIDAIWFADENANVK
ncbi:signal peptidase II [Candidatus Albibeggiatoa sp. nov. NOAA]|uniref:signal peptidase II n=1 Tax=Candidatus Albibeggiatoa sp. nov. NOAA TaxID=3162724 RepID=UPI0032F25A26|nr:signal peptidase II [Thiotrichaceae bacterium]